MKTSMLSAVAGAVFLASGAMAGAGEPVKLGPAELDAVTAGSPGDRAYTAIAAVSQSFSQSNDAVVLVEQNADARGRFAFAVNVSEIDIDQTNNARDVRLVNLGDVSASID